MVYRYFGKTVHLVVYLMGEQKMTHEEFIAREGWPYILVSLGVAAVLYYAGFEKLSGIAVILAIFSTFFFRNPKRHPQMTRTVLAPADGRVMEIQPVIEEDYLQDKAIKVSIFLNNFNVHVNRMPTAGHVEWINKDGNSFLPLTRRNQPP
jgi:phosphatidylserine decarboxylase